MAYKSVSFVIDALPNPTLNISRISTLANANKITLKWLVFVAQIINHIVYSIMKQNAPLAHSSTKVEFIASHAQPVAWLVFKAINVWLVGRSSYSISPLPNVLNCVGMVRNLLINVMMEITRMGMAVLEIVRFKTNISVRVDRFTLQIAAISTNPTRYTSTWSLKSADKPVSLSHSN